MYMTSRQVTARAGHLEDTIGLVTWVVGAINEKVGAQLGASVEIGGDPNSIGVTGPWPSLAAYEEARRAIQSDPEIAAAIRMASNVADMVRDQIIQVLRPPGERAEFVGLNSARVDLAHMADAVPFCLEVAEAATEITGNEIGFARAVTGDANQVGWYSFHDSLASLQAGQEKLDGSEDFLAFYKRSADLMVPNSLTMSIRQML